jgi:hypothetical protein
LIRRLWSIMLWIVGRCRGMPGRDPVIERVWVQAGRYACLFWSARGVERGFPHGGLKGWMASNEVRLGQVYYFNMPSSEETASLEPKLAKSLRLRVPSSGIIRTKTHDRIQYPTRFDLSRDTRRFLSD